MTFQTVFKRYELKYLLTPEQKEIILDAMRDRMVPDSYGRSTIRNVYYDTESYILIRRSIEKPVYKEKLRMRSYVRAAKNEDVFVELKKKYKGVVYKRRISLPEDEASAWIGGSSECTVKNQISKEIDYFKSYYGGLRPSVFLSYEREAYFSKDDGGFRVTFDDNILYRTDDISLCGDIYGSPVLPTGKVLMEIKCGGGIPLWMSSVLSKERIYKTSFSKYGKAYLSILESGQISCPQI